MISRSVQIVRRALFARTQPIRHDGLQTNARPGHSRTPARSIGITRDHRIAIELGKGAGIGVWRDPEFGGPRALRQQTRGPRRSSADLSRRHVLHEQFCRLVRRPTGGRGRQGQSSLRQMASKPLCGVATYWAKNRVGRRGRYLSRIAKVGQRTGSRINVCTRRKRTCGPRRGSSGLRPKGDLRAKRWAPTRFLPSNRDQQTPMPSMALLQLKRTHRVAAA